MISKITLKIPIMNKRKFFKLSDITNRLQQILQPAIGKFFWVRAIISSGRETEVWDAFKELEERTKEG